DPLVAGSGPWPSFGVTIVLTLAAMVKLPMVVALVVWMWLLLRGAAAERRFRVGAAHAGLIAVTAAAVSAPLWAGLRTLRSLGTLASVEGWASGVRLIARGIESVARAAFGQAGVAPAGHLVRAIFLAVFALAMWRFLG